MQVAMQTRSDNCLAACLASLLEMPLESVPNFSRFKNDWRAHFRAWLDKNQIVAVCVRYYSPPTGLSIAIGRRVSGSRHACIYEDGKLLHDPLQGGGGLAQVEWFWVLYKRI